MQSYPKSHDFFYITRKVNSKIHMKSQKIPDFQNNLEKKKKKNGGGVIILLNFKLYYKLQ